MFKQSKFETLLRELEGPTASKKQLDKLRDYLKNDNVFHPLFESYLSKRLRDNIHPERLLNMAYHLEKSDETSYLSRTLNRQVVSHMLLKDECFDQFYFMSRHDIRTDRHVLNSLVENFFEYGSDSFDALDKIAPYINTDKYEIILKIMDSNESRNYRTLRLIEKLPTEEYRLLLIRALETHSLQFIKIMEWPNAATTKHISELLIQNGDDDKFAVALRNTLILPSQLETAYSLSTLIEDHIQHIPVTAARLYYRAEQEERWEYLLILGANKNKKELLRSIVKSKDQEMIDKFFAIYKNSPEVKHLVPFM